QQVGQGSGAYSGRRADLHSAGRARNLAVNTVGLVSGRGQGAAGLPAPFVLSLSHLARERKSDVFSLVLVDVARPLLCRPGMRAVLGWRIIDA
ncbi:MAG: hypothetical protein RL768_2784, partial [Nitrospirota bacterium]